MKVIPAYLVIVIAVLFLGCSGESTLRSDRPLTKAAVSKELVDFPLPTSARSIYYLFYAGGLQDLEEYVRFDVDPQELDSSVDTLVAWNNKQIGRTLSYPREPLASAITSRPRKEFLPMPWWEPTTISDGYYRGHIDSHALRIYVDQSRSRVYVYRND